MTITYHSTRNNQLSYTASEAILAGIAPDGGLFVPSTIPQLTLALEDLAKKNYQEIAFHILKAFLTDFTDDEINESIQVYNQEKFDTALITPLVEAGHDHYLELFHGPTIAFKDMALSILPKLMTISAKKNNSQEDIVILTATSGDTGKAALVGFADVPNTHIIVFYPKDGVSDIQEKQMLTQKGDNVHVVSIEGNFDDAQTKVKELFADKDLASDLHANKLRFSSANSINIGRLIPQIIYYVYAYGQLVDQLSIQAGDAINVVVPTGNFGNILAAYYAKEMGLPINKLVVASNENNVLTDFFKTGTYNRNRDFILTSSPSMDILVSSNLERLLYHLASEDTQLVASYMASLSKDGLYEVTADMLEKTVEFYAGFASEQAVSDQIKHTFEESNYVLDPHTAVAAYVANDYRSKTNDQTTTVIASTASPYKFPLAVLEATNSNFKETSLEDSLSQLRDLTGIAFPNAIEEALHDPIRHHTSVKVNEMKDIVKEKLGIQ